jgi:hypothetical protein
MVRAMAIGVVLLATLGSALLAQNAASMLRRDARVRMWSERDGIRGREGRVVAIAGDTLTVNFGYWSPTHDTPLVQQVNALSDLDSLEVRLPGPVRRWRGALEGALLGGGILAVVGYATGGCEHRDVGEDCVINASDSAVIAGVLGATVGLIAGALIGHHGSRWVAVSLPKPAR